MAAPTQCCQHYYAGMLFEGLGTLDENVFSTRREYYCSSVSLLHCHERTSSVPPNAAKQPLLPIVEFFKFTAY